MRDERILALAAKVRYVVDPNNPYPSAYTGHVRMTLKDGRVFEERQPHIRGGVHEPLSRAEIERKFRGNAAYGGWPAPLAERFLAFAREAFDGTMDLSRVSPLVFLAARRACRAGLSRQAGEDHRPRAAGRRPGPDRPHRRRPARPRDGADRSSSRTSSGGGGQIASQATARAAPDGYTLMVGYVGTHGTNPAVRKVPYDAVRDFTAIAMVGGTPNVLVVHPSLPVDRPASR